MNSQLEHALKLRADGEEEQSRQLLIELVSQDLQNGELNFHCGETHDGMGLEEEAVEYYERAIRIGLPNELLRDAYVCLGSTYKVIGELEKSLDMLSKGENEFPDYEPIKVCRALTLHSMGDYSKALETVLIALLKTTNDEGIRKYSRALYNYAGTLDESGKE